MSSHHIIRENQEPALIIQDFNALDDEELGQLLEWSPTVITDRENVDWLLSREIKIDVIWSRNDFKLNQEHTKIYPLKGEFLEDALAKLISEKHTAVNILCNYIPLHLNTIAAQINIVLFHQQKRFVYVQNAYEKWKPKGELIFVAEQYLKSFHGLEHVDPDSFVTTKDGFIQIEFNTNDFVLLGESI